jgi:hypothetical protein
VTEHRWLTPDLFTPLVGETFVLETGDGGTERVELVAATEGAQLGGPGPDGQQRQQFSLLFVGTARLAQATYPLTHPALGRIELFLVPLGPDARGLRYEAAFA